MKIAALIVTFGINIVVGAVLFFFLILSLNGFHEKDANWGIYLYIGLSLLTAVLTSVLSVLATGWLVNKKQMSAVAAGSISMLVFVILGAVFNFVSVFAGIIMADIKRVNF